MAETLILILAVLLLTLTLGLPLLLKPDSPVPDVIASGILAVMVLGFAWSMDAWWILLPILALAAFVAWLDKAGREEPGDGDGASARTRLRLRLWLTAAGLNLALLVCLLVLIATGSGAAVMMPVLSWLAVTLAATAAFRLSFQRSCRRDRRAPAAGE